MNQQKWPPFYYGILLLILSITSATAQLRPCDSRIVTTDLVTTFQVEFREKDPGAFTPSDAASDDYAQEIEIYGTVGGDINLTLLPLPSATTGIERQPQRYFAVQYDSRRQMNVIRMLQGIDRDGATAQVSDDTDVIEYRMLCRTAGRADLYIPLKITLIDINDNSPQYINTPYSFDLPELTPREATISTILQAEDKDSGQNRRLTYTLETIAGQNVNSSNFLIPLPQQGPIVLITPVDFEDLFYRFGTKQFRIRARVNDGGNRTDSTDVTINLIDEDDLGPVFSYDGCLSYSPYPGFPVCINPQYKATITSGEIMRNITVFPVPESDPETATRIIARDQDTLNADIRYYIEETIPSGYRGYFRLTTVPAAPINGVTFHEAVISQIRAINRDTLRTTLTIVLRAEEITESRRYGTALVHLTIAAANIHAPSITFNIPSNTAYIRENSPRGTLIGDESGNTKLQIVITDQDLAPGDPQPQYSIEIYRRDVFEVRDDGSIAVATDNLDYEAYDNPRLQYTMS